MFFSSAPDWMQAMLRFLTADWLMTLLLPHLQWSPPPLEVLFGDSCFSSLLLLTSCHSLHTAMVFAPRSQPLVQVLPFPHYPLEPCFVLFLRCHTCALPDEAVNRRCWVYFWRAERELYNTAQLGPRKLSHAAKALLTITFSTTHYGLRI